MKSSQKASSIILWIARILAILEIGFILFFLLADLFGGESGGAGFGSFNEILSFAFFPILPLIGLSLALKWPSLGGMISTLGFIGLSIIRPDLIADPMIMILAVPGILFLVAWILDRRRTKSKF
ncbi:MAG: hypothetical protein HKO90_02855 [Flavobacteriaceae bacterium]|nr:hypothetical protein [Flavobacteriaceae bacterium]